MTPRQPLAQSDRQAIRRAFKLSATLPREDRYQWASEMQEALQNFLANEEQVYNTKMLAGWMRDQFRTEMQREAGVDIGDRGPAYFTVRYDADKIAANPDAFTRDITEAYKAEGVAADVLEAVWWRERELPCPLPSALLEMREVDGASLFGGEHE